MIKRSKSSGLSSKNGLFRNIYKFFHSGEDEHTKLIEAVDDSDKIRISTEGLRCPICFTVFGSAPTILPCGHSFCTTCIQIQTQHAIYQAPAMHEPKLECALCRHTVSAQTTLSKNYIVEQILNSIEPVDVDDVVTENEAVNAYKILVERARQQIRESDKKIAKLTKTNRELRNALKILVPFTVVAIAMLLMSSVSK